MYRLLIADDEPIERAVICKILQEYFQDNIEILVAENGREAIRLFKENGCSVAVLDIEMPGINGLEAAKAIRTMDKHCSIIFLTAFDHFSYAKKAITVQALDYLLKPASDEELVAVIEEGIRLAEEKTAWYISDDKETAGSGEGEEQLDCVRLLAVKKAIRDYIDDHYREDISLQDIAVAMKYSDAYFCKVFKQCFEKNFVTYLSEFRIEKAKQMLSDVTSNVKEISTSVGFRNSSYFAKVFRRLCGVSPSDYRMSILVDKSKVEHR